MNNSLNQNLNQNNQQNLNWEQIQEDFKIKFGKEVYESWLKKMQLLKQILTICYYQSLQDLLEIGLPQDI